MIYQSDFSKKQTLSDGATNFPDFMIRNFGCYFLSLLFQERVSTKKEVRDIYYYALQSQAIDFDCFVRNPLFFSTKTKKVTKVLANEKILPSCRFIIGRYRLDDPILKKQGLQSHFVVLDPMTLDVVYDPIEEGSRHVREGELIDLRVFI